MAFCNIKIVLEKKEKVRIRDAKPIQRDKIAEWETGILNDLCDVGVLRKMKWR